MADFKRYESNSANTIEAILQGMGINPGPFANLIDAYVRQGWTTEELTAHIYGSQAFKNMFPGIFREDGSMKMSAYEYRQQGDEYQSMARMYGVEIDKARIGSLIGGNVSMQEFTDRLTAIQRVSEFKPAFEQFKQALKARGISTAGLDTDEDIANFILGKGPEKFYKIWEETQVGTAAHQAGIKLNTKLERSIAKKTPGMMSEAELQAHMQNLAKHITSTMPMSKIQGMGLSKKDLVTLEFGGANQAKIYEKVKRIIGTDEAFYEEQRAVQGMADFSQTSGSQQQRAQV